MAPYGTSRVWGGVRPAADIQPEARQRTPAMDLAIGEFLFASRSVRAHVVRGVLGFGLLGATFAAMPTYGWLALIPLVLAVVALRGCPTCWTIGLMQTISRQERTTVCKDGDCSLVSSG